MRLDALLTLGFPSAPNWKFLAWPHTVTRRLIMQKARRQTLPEGHSSPTACKCMVSGTLSLPYSGYFSLSAHATGSLPVVSKYLALRGGPREFIPGFTCPVLLGREQRVAHAFRVQDFHLLWSLFPKRSPKHMRSPQGVMTP